MSEVKAVENKDINLAKLHVRYIPVVTPVHIWGHDMRLITSPHVELMQLFKKHGFDMDRIRKTRYYNERSRRCVIGIKKWTNEKIKAHIKKRYKIYKSMVKFGINKRLLIKDPVYILKDPFWNTRFGNAPDWVHGYEIWNGAGRCSAAYVLGYKKIPVVIAKDTRPGSKKKGKFKDKLKHVKGVWDDRQGNTRNA